MNRELLSEPYIELNGKSGPTDAEGCFQILNMLLFRLQGYEIGLPVQVLQKSVNLL